MPENCPETKYCEVAVNLQEIYGDIKSQLSSGTEIMKSLKAQQDDFMDRFERVMEKQDQRIRVMEKKVWYATGGVSVITAGVMHIATKLFGGGHG
ncbi:MAG TPA: hypothetical protein ACFYEK_09025 [Candidatus Wunengus sp. YC60]|uniref:hypothetical protein n=1 Tax=Candidatus Wunengus sp. YC60 TaxID=3367697 RepID=UPI004025E5C6